MSVDPEIPPAGEEIHLPGPTLLPLLLTVAVTAILLGITSITPLAVAGIILLLYVLVRWTLDTKNDMEHLPLDMNDHSHHH